MAPLGQNPGSAMKVRGGSRILVRGEQRFDTREGPEPKICSKLPENCMILSWGHPPGPQGPLDPLVKVHHLYFEEEIPEKAATVTQKSMFCLSQGHWRFPQKNPRISEC